MQATTSVYGNEQLPRVYQESTISPKGLASDFKPNVQYFAAKARQLNESSYNLRDKVFRKLDNLETKLNNWLPPLPFQTAYDNMVREVNQAFSLPDTGWNQFNKRLDDLGAGKWYEQLANFLVKLPIKVARNILKIMGNIIGICVCVPLEIVMHPLKTPIQLARLLTALVHALIQPETWTKIGAGVFGTSLASTTVTGNPISILGVGIGAALSITGISVGIIKTALLAEKDKRFDASKQYLAKQSLVFKEDLLTSYCMGLLLAAIQKIVRECQFMRHEGQHNRNVRRVQTENKNAAAKVKLENDIRTTESQKQYTHLQKNEFLSNNNLPDSEVYSHDGLNFSVRWHIERAAHGNIPLKDLPDSKLVIENLQTGVETIRTDFYVNGYFTTSYYDAYVYDPAIDAYVWVSKPYIDYVPGYWSYTLTEVPIYEKFCGFDVATKGWVSPELVPAPTPIPLPIKPPMPPAFNIPSSCIKACAAAPASIDREAVKK